MAKNICALQSFLMDFLGCCTKRDNSLLPADDETNTRLATLRRKRGSMVERQALIADHASNVKTFAGHYQFNDTDVLGTGSFGTVRKARLKRCPSIVRAVKELRKVSADQTRTVRREVLILRNLDHPNICKLFETFEDETHLYLVMELITGRPLLDELEEIMRQGHNDEKWNMAVMRQVFDGLRYCHRQGVLHRDMKLENIMVDEVYGEPHIKIIDFGFAVASEPITGFQSKYREGTRAYMAPEVLKHARYSTASDMWSAGVVLFLLILREFPDRLCIPEQTQRIESLDARDLLRRLLERDPWSRMSAEEAAKHAWTCGRSTHDNHSAQKENMQKAVTSFLDFYRCDKLQKAALTAVASQLCGQQLQDMRRHFQELDSDGNGVVTKEEMVALFEASAPPSISEPGKWVHEVFDQLDSDGSGELEFTEFQAAVMQAYVGISEETMQAAFHALDVDSSGTISREELGRVMCASNEELTSYIAKADLNGDGELDFDEFKAIFASLPPSLSSTYETCDFNINSLVKSVVPSVRAPKTETISSNRPKPCKERQAMHPATPPLSCLRPRRRSTPAENSVESMPHEPMPRACTDLRF